MEPGARQQIQFCPSQLLRRTVPSFVTSSLCRLSIFQFMFSLPLFMLTYRTLNRIRLLWTCAGRPNQRERSVNLRGLKLTNEQIVGREWNRPNLHINGKRKEEKPYFTVEGLTFRLHASPLDDEILERKIPFSEYFLSDARLGVVNIKRNVIVRVMIRKCQPITPRLLRDSTIEYKSLTSSDSLVVRTLQEQCVYIKQRFSFFRSTFGYGFQHIW